ncbi:dipeptidase PepE [Variovorax sp. YR216]|uniref:dipeptidase PepE n=1 Tax=Variovorax sp. YR216 TaxID=1882828 RepID=UPI000897E455|nr:dipeptidase PepE [Variovorax sp. YR216]SEA79778.1 dipeptidase E Serine peptidase. MEROPS family S51 [Variovorax sp. YR216]
MRLLLLSNSRTPTGEYLTAALEPARALIRDRRRALFVPFAGVTIEWDAYTDKVRQALSPLSLTIEGIHTQPDALNAVHKAELIIVGGGNTFHLLKCCRERGLLGAIAERVRSGAADYMGWSAGANLACPTICTTNDMPIVDPGGFDALGLVPFQINAHYTNALPAGHQGETRNERLAELLKARPAMRVIGLPEGDWLDVEDERVRLAGLHAAPWFEAGAEPVILQPGEELRPHRAA